MKFSELSIGQTAQGKLGVSAELIDAYAKVSGDFNPIHVDQERAIAAGFKGRIAHGLVCQAEVSRLLASDLPGEGTILLQETFKFLSPVYIGDTITVTLRVAELLPEKSRASFEFECLNQDGKPVMAGTALVKLSN